MELIAKRAFLTRLKAQGLMPQAVYRLVVKAVNQVDAASGIVPKIRDLCAPISMEALREEVEPWIAAIEYTVSGQESDGPLR